MGDPRSTVRYSIAVVLILVAGASPTSSVASDGVRPPIEAAISREDLPTAFRQRFIEGTLPPVIVMDIDPFGFDERARAKLYQRTPSGLHRPIEQSLSRTGAAPQLRRKYGWSWWHLRSSIQHLEKTLRRVAEDVNHAFSKSAPETCAAQQLRAINEPLSGGQLVRRGLPEADESVDFGVPYGIHVEDTDVGLILNLTPSDIEQADRRRQLPPSGTRLWLGDQPYATDAPDVILRPGQLALFAGHKFARIIPHTKGIYHAEPIGSPSPLRCMAATRFYFFGNKSYPRVQHGTSRRPLLPITTSKRSGDPRR